MHCNSILASAGLLVAGALAQSPPKYDPRTIFNLGVGFGVDYLLPNESLPQALVDGGKPTVFSPGHFTDKYMLLLVDLDIPLYVTDFTADDQPYLAPGLGAGRTTRLHWWQGNVTHSIQNGTFVYDASTALSPYAGPQPPPGDSAHHYVFYLFNQPAGYVPPPAALAGDFIDPGSEARFNFSVQALAANVGNPLAANYMRVENAGNTGAPTTASRNVIPAVALSFFS